MMDQINISLSEVSNIAAQIRSCNASLDDILSGVNRMMNEINSIWQSDGQERLLVAFQKFSTRFIEESEVLESYAGFLDATVSDYDSLESTIVANAGNFD